MARLNKHERVAKTRILAMCASRGVILVVEVESRFTKFTLMSPKGSRTVTIGRFPRIPEEALDNAVRGARKSIKELT